MMSRRGQLGRVMGSPASASSSRSRCIRGARYASVLPLQRSRNWKHQHNEGSAGAARIMACGSWTRQSADSTRRPPHWVSSAQLVSAPCWCARRSDMQHMSPPGQLRGFSVWGVLASASKTAWITCQHGPQWRCAARLNASPGRLPPADGAPSRLGGSLLATHQHPGHQSRTGRRFPPNAC